MPGFNSISHASPRRMAGKKLCTIRSIDDRGHSFFRNEKKREEISSTLGTNATGGEINVPHRRWSHGMFFAPSTHTEGGRMDKESLEALARALQRQRKVYLGEFKEAETSLRTISEDRESEIEESAQQERSARFLSHLDDRAIRAVEEIDAALERISAGVYGKCPRCGRAITIARLRFLPAVRYCVECAKNREQSPVMIRAEIGHSVELPGDLALLSDGELEALIHERIKDDGRVDTEELRIMCRRGVVYLYGALPSEKEHHVLLGILTDLLGLKEVVDRIGVDEVLWERAERSKREKGLATLPWDEPEGTEDIVETAEEGKEFSPPDRPIAEDEE